MTLSFQLPDEFILPYVGSQPKWGPIGYVTYKRTYARPIKRRALYDRHINLAVQAGARVVEAGEEPRSTEEYWLTCVRVVEGTFSILYDHCRKLQVPWDDEKGLRDAREMFRLMWEFKFLPPGRGLFVMGSPIVEKKGAGALNNPLDESTLVMTRDFGWVPLHVIEGQRVSILTSTKLYGRDETNSASQSKWVEADISVGEMQPCVEITFIDDFRQERKVVASENHRWFKKDNPSSNWERVTSLELSVGDRVPIVLPRFQAEPNKEAMKHGLFFGDGTRSNGLLCQFDDSVHLLGDLFQGYEIHDGPSGGRSIRGCPLGWGQIPTKIDRSQSSYAIGFLMGYFAADGCVTEEHCAPKLSSARSDELAEVREMFERLGIRTTQIVGGERSTNFSESCEIFSFKLNKHDLWPEFFLKRSHREKYERHMAGISRKTEKRVASITSIVPVGERRVICATVPHYEQFVIEGFILTSNCAFVSTKDIDKDFAEPFCFLMDFSALGVGVGGDTRGAGKVVIVRPHVEMGWSFRVDDTREGWVLLLRTVLNAFVGKGSLPGNIDYTGSRAKGAPLETFGGTASGPEALVSLIDDLCIMLRDREGVPITSADIVDIFNLIGRCVVAGNSRRSAEIMFGDTMDEGFLELKDPVKYKKELASHRWASNNSVFAEVGQSYERVGRQTAKNGEPGYFWLENAQKYGRMGHGEPDWKDINALGGNPCLEQTLHQWELCTLVETFPALHVSQREYLHTLKYAYLYAKTVTLVPTHYAPTNAVLLKNRRIGCSMSGISQAISRFGRHRFFQMCETGYNYIQELDAEYSDWMCVPRSLKTTSVKPAGTTSLLPGQTPGIHDPISEYYHRVIRFSKDSWIVSRLRASGYQCIDLDEAKEPNTCAVYFPVKVDGFDRAESDVSMWEQLERAAQMQHHWADNQVSVTVKFDPEREGKDIPRALEYYQTRLKGVSFLPNREISYEHAPYQPITREEYERVTSGLLPYDLGSATHEVTDSFCDGDKCEWKPTPRDV